MNIQTIARSYFPGMGEAVANRTVNRRIFTDAQIELLPDDKIIVLNAKDPDFIAWDNAAAVSGYTVEIGKADHMGAPDLRLETWADVAHRVATGNASLIDRAMTSNIFGEEYAKMHHHLSQASLLMSGRHLQHGDERQGDRPMEVFTNCASAAATFLNFTLLLNGAGVGRSYDDDMMKADWTKMPEIRLTIAADYPDRKKFTQEWDAVAGAMVPEAMVPDVLTPKAARADMKKETRPTTWIDVADSRGGWGKTLEVLERMAYQGRTDEVVYLEFSLVRGYGAPIRGMQNRPSSGPGPLMKALLKIAALRGQDMSPFMAAMFADHYAAECVVVGGARRAARMATKTWRDTTIFDFISIKRLHDLWSSNNSVTIDQEFRDRCAKVRDLLRQFKETNQTPDLLLRAGRIDATDLHAWKVLYALADASYHDGTGEPGIINQDRLHEVRGGLDEYLDGLYVGSKSYQIDDETVDMLKDLAVACMACRYTMITNPCGEIALLMMGAYCVIADVVPFYATSDDDAEDAFRTATRALIRTNLMDAIYNKEVKRTNRIGVGMTGFHEWVYDRFKFTWHDMINEVKSREMWQMVSRFKRAVVEEATEYSNLLGVEVPHTNTTMKPAGTTSKLFGVTEGAHLPSMRWYMRWVQFRSDDPLVQEYAAKGYQTKELKSYPGTTIVGFPTAPTICEMDGGDWVVTAAEATPEEQYRYLRLLEKYWIVGVEEDGITALADTGNQISYTLKYNPEVVSFERFLDTLIDGQFSIRCCSVMPQVELTKYEYQPEEPISRDDYLKAAAAIKAGAPAEDIGFEHIDCGSGGCPVDFDEDETAA